MTCRKKRGSSRRGQRWVALWFLMKSQCEKVIRHCPLADTDGWTVSHITLSRNSQQETRQGSRWKKKFQPSRASHPYRHPGGRSRNPIPPFFFYIIRYSAQNSKLLGAQGYSVDNSQKVTEGHAKIHTNQLICSECLWTGGGSRSAWLEHTHRQVMQTPHRKTCNLLAVPAEPLGHAWSCIHSSSSSRSSSRESPSCTWAFVMCNSIFTAQHSSTLARGRLNRDREVSSWKQVVVWRTRVLPTTHALIPHSLPLSLIK